MTNPQSLSDDKFVWLQNLAKLSLDEQEKQKIQSQLNESLDAIKVFNELDTDNVPTLDHPGDLTNVMREDVVTPSLTQEQALQNAPHTYQGFFLVPAILKH